MCAYRDDGLWGRGHLWAQDCEAMLDDLFVMVTQREMRELRRE